ncbi:MAG: hypothetical protein ACLFNQ_05650 [Spirochaetaceae bacterium]
MKTRTERSTKALLCLVITSFLLAACSPERDGAVDRLLATEPDPVERSEADPERIRELERDVERYREEVEEALRAVGESANAHRLLGMRFLDQRMFGPALEQFSLAVDIQSENPTLFYYVGIAAGLHAQAATDRVEQEARFEQAERAYMRALELRPRYAAAAYALSVLLAYELDRPEDALEYADIAVDIRSQNDRAHAVRAYALSALGRVEEAIRAYDLVIETADDEQTRSTARALQEELRSQ